MSTTKYKMQEGIFIVDIEKPTEKDIKKYYDTTGEIRSSSKSASSPREYQKATILHTFDEEKYPIDSIWMMNDVPGSVINFFGERLIEIQERDLHARIS